MHYDLEGGCIKLGIILVSPLCFIILFLMLFNVLEFGIIFWGLTYVSVPVYCVYKLFECLPFLLE